MFTSSIIKICTNLDDFFFSRVVPSFGGSIEQDKSWLKLPLNTNKQIVY
jgi:hypothetical protein